MRRYHETFRLWEYLLFAVVTLAVLCLCVCIGSVRVPLGDTLAFFAAKLTGGALPEGLVSSIMPITVWAASSVSSRMSNHCNSISRASRVIFFAPIVSHPAAPRYCFFAAAGFSLYFPVLPPLAQGTRRWYTIPVSVVFHERR